MGARLETKKEQLREFKGIAKWSLISLLFWVLMAILYFWPRSANAAEFYGAIGQSEFSLFGTGNWYVDEQPHSVQKTDIAWTVGFRERANRYLSARVGYVDLGKVRSDAYAFYPDYAYHPGGNGCTVNPCVPLNHYSGTFATYGFNASVEVSAYVYGTEVFVGVGEAYLKNNYKMTINMGAGPNPWCPEGMQIGQETHMHFDNEWRMSSFYSAGFKKENVFVYFANFPKASGNDGIFKGVKALFVGLSF